MCLLCVHLHNIIANDTEIKVFRLIRENILFISFVEKHIIRVAKSNYNDITQYPMEMGYCMKMLNHASILKPSISSSCFVHFILQFHTTISY